LIDATKNYCLLRILT